MLDFLFWGILLTSNFMCSPLSWIHNSISFQTSKTFGQSKNKCSNVLTKLIFNVFLQVHVTNLVKKLISNGLRISVSNFEMKLISKSLLHFYVRNLLTKLILCGFSSGFCGQYCK